MKCYIIKGWLSSLNTRLVWRMKTKNNAIWAQIANYRGSLRSINSTLVGKCISIGGPIVNRFKTFTIFSEKKPPFGSILRFLVALLWKKDYLLVADLMLGNDTMENLSNESYLKKFIQETNSSLLLDILLNMGTLK